VSSGSGSWEQVVAIVLVCATTFAIGAMGLRLSRTTSDFYVASRAIDPRWNASAIGGEYLSAASFLGVAGLILAYGTDMLWYPIGYTAGYLVLLVLVSAPLRRSGAYTLPDFAEMRLGDPRMRRLAAVLVVAIGCLYLIPQFQGAGLALRTVTGTPAWVGTLLVAVVVLTNVAAGAMRSITLLQAVQYWLKLTAIAVPVVLLLIAWHLDGSPDPAAPDPVARHAISLTVPDTVTVEVRTPVTMTLHGTLDGHRVDGVTTLGPGTARIGGGTHVDLPAGAVVPEATGLAADDGARWAVPGAAEGNRNHSLYRTYSLLIALLLGTMGLPHVLVRFYTNPDGRAARRTTLIVVALLGAFYLFPPVYGAIGRLYAPDLLLTGHTDTVVLEIPRRLLPAPWGDLTAALLTAGAFAAFLSTSGGLAISVAGVLSRDLFPGRSGRRGFRAAAALVIGTAGALSLFPVHTGLADTVGLAFALAASTFCPLLVLGIWWRRLTVAGAAAGMVVGGLGAGTAILLTLGGIPRSGLAAALVAQPAAWSVPAAFLTMVLVSLATRRGATPATGRIMVRLHTPESLDVDRGETPPAPRFRARR